MHRGGGVVMAQKMTPEQFWRKVENAASEYVLAEYPGDVSIPAEAMAEVIATAFLGLHPLRPDLAARFRTVLNARVNPPLPPPPALEPSRPIAVFALPYIRPTNEEEL